MCTVLSTSSLAYQIKQRKLTDLKESTKQKRHQKLERLQQKLEQKFAPGQSEELITHVLHFQNEDENSEIPEDPLFLL